MGKKIAEFDDLGRIPLSNVHESILYQILVRVPAIYLYKDARLVCRSWNRIISASGFISENFIETKDDLLIQWPTKQYNNYYFKVNRAEIGPHLDSNLYDLGLHRIGQVSSSCNGLLLVKHTKKSRLLQVINPATKFFVNLPMPPSHCLHADCGSAIGFDPFTDKYKVVHICTEEFGFEIFDLGCSESEWKSVPGPWVTEFRLPFSNKEYRWNDPVSMNGKVLHWDVRSKEFLISMDICNEKSIKASLPDIGEEIKPRKYTLLELGGYLSFAYNASDSQIDFWVLEDFEGKVWSKKLSVRSDLVNYTMAKPSLFSISLPNIGNLIPLCAVDNGDILVFKHTNCSLYIYDIKQKAMKKLGMAMKKLGRDFQFDKLQIIPYRSSMFRITSPGL